MIMASRERLKWSLWTSIFVVDIVIAVIAFRAWESPTTEYSRIKHNEKSWLKGSPTLWCKRKWERGKKGVLETLRKFWCGQKGENIRNKDLLIATILPACFNLQADCWYCSWLGSEPAAVPSRSHCVDICSAYFHVGPLQTPLKLFRPVDIVLLLHGSFWELTVNLSEGAWCIWKMDALQANKQNKARSICIYLYFAGQKKARESCPKKKSRWKKNIEGRNYRSSWRDCSLSTQLLESSPWQRKHLFCFTWLVAQHRNIFFRASSFCTLLTSFGKFRGESSHGPRSQQSSLYCFKVVS